MSSSSGSVAQETPPTAGDNDAVFVAFSDGGHVVDVGNCGECNCNCDDECAMDGPTSLQTFTDYIVSPRAGRRTAVSAPPPIITNEDSEEEKAGDMSRAECIQDGDMDILHSVLSHHPLFHLVDAPTLGALVRAMKRREFAPGDVLAPQWCLNTSFTVLTQGSVHARLNEASNETSEMEQQLLLVQTVPPEELNNNDNNDSDSSNKSGGIKTTTTTATDDCGAGGGATESDKPCNVYFPGESFFSINLLYATWPSHILKAGNDGAVVYQLDMSSFKSIMANLLPAQMSDSHEGSSINMEPEITLRSCSSEKHERPAGDDTEEERNTGNSSQKESMQSYIFPFEDSLLAAPDVPKALPGEEMDACEASELCRRAQKGARRYAVLGESMLPNNIYRPRIVDKTPEERAMLLRMLRCKPFLAHIPEHYWRFVVDAFECHRFLPGEIITSADGELSHEFQWIECGVVVSSSSASHHGDTNNNRRTRNNNNSNGGDVDDLPSAGLSVWRAGDEFLVERLLYMHNDRIDCVPERYAAADQEEKVVLWTIRRAVLKRVLVMATLREQQRLLSLIDGVRVFYSLSRAERRQLADAIIPVSYARGSCILSKGSTADCVFLIDTGIVEATCVTDRGTVGHLRFIGRRSCVGAVEVFSGSESRFDYVAYTHATGYYFRQDDFVRLLGESAFQKIANSWALCGSAQQGEELQALERLQKELCDVASDTESEKEYTDDMFPVEVKTPEDDNFLHRFLFTSAIYKEATSMQRGLAVAAFESKRELPYGWVLYAEDSTRANEAEKRQYLYVIADGCVTLSHDGEMITTYRRGQSVGETILLQKPDATPETTAVVTSSTCTVYQLDRKIFRRLLLPAYVQQLRATRSLLITAPIASRLSGAAITAVSGGSAMRVYMPGEVVLPHGGEVRSVELLLDGTVDVALWQGEGEGRRLHVVSSLGATDVIGALDLLHQCPPAVCYLAASRLWTLSVPADFFVDTSLQRPAVVEYLFSLQSSPRYAFYTRRMIDDSIV